MNKVNTNDQLNRMKSLMNYGLQTESKKAPYSAVEYQKVGADGKVYGIVREGTKYYIKSAPNKQNLIKEDFGYIGGFRNRKDHEYGNFALAQKQFDLKMMSLKEAANNPTFNVESWDLNKKEVVVTEASDKMKGEILRERQIMKNAMMIMENSKKECGGEMPGLNKTEKTNIEGASDKEVAGDGVGNGPAKDTFTEPAKVPQNCSKEINGQPVNEEEVLGWNRDKDYMDKSHGTEIGDSAPFDGPEARNIDDQDKKVTKTGEMKNGVVENHGTSMHDTDNQNSPAVGVGEGPSDDNNKPFDDEKGKQIDEAITEIGDSLEDDAPIDDDVEGDDPLADEDPEMGEDGEMGEPIDTDELGDDEGLGDEDIEGDEDFGDEDLGGEDPIEDDLENRISAMEDLLSQIAAKLGIEQDVDADAYEDDDLFGDEDGEDLGDEDIEGDEFGDESDFGGEDLGGEGEVEPEGDFEDEEDEYPMESRRRNGVQIFETKAFKRAMRKQRVNEGEDDDERRNLISKEIGKILRSKDAGKASRAKRNGRRLDDLSTEELRNLDNEGYMRRNGGLVNEEGMTPFTDNGRVPSGNMNKLDDFGKHPAYQKVVMDLPPKDMKEFPGNYDMNDDSVKNDTPYGEKIGDGAPFEIDPEAIDNAIAEAFDRLRRSKKG